MKIMRSKTENGMFFGIHVSSAELEHEYPTYVTIYIELAAENPTISNTLMMLEAIASELKE